MKLHEYQAKELLKSMGTVVPRGGAATTVEEAMGIADELGGNFWVVKAQVHAGGRGKGRFKELVSEDVLQKVVQGIPVDGVGGVALCKTRDQVEEAAKTMLGNTLVTKQTGIDGVVVKTIYVTPGADIKDEIYAAVLLDRQKSQLVLMCSTEGGTEIEEVAEHNPDAIKKVWIDPAVGLGGWQAREMAFKLGFTGKAFKGACKMFSCLVNTYLKYDASLVEINPLIIDTEDNVIALDAKMSVDPNASFRHKALFAEEDESEKDPYEAEAEQFDLNFIKLDGNIGCMVNGAGLAMATMDIIKYCGGEPANFLDVGGGAKVDQVIAALKIISSDTAVKAILINIFGGIMRCDVIAQGVIEAVKELDLKLPLVVRLEGTNVEIGKQLLKDSGLAIIAAEDLGDAAKKAVQAVS